jgi:biopolymer transport protein ExbD
MRRNATLRRMQRRARKPSTLLLVPMIDIFTVLVTFLLMTAVFSRTVIVELKLPTDADNPQFVEPPPGLELEVIVRKDMVQVADKKTGPLRDGTFRKADADAPYDLAGLSEYLQIVKSQYPDKLEASVLLERDIPYDTLVQVMDTVRIVEQKQGNTLVQAELFPEVALGDAPEIEATAQPTAPAQPAGAKR